MKKIALFWGVASLLVACTAQLETPVETIDEPVVVEEQAPVLYASISEEAQTKVYLDEDYKVLWTADDRISVFNKNTYNQQYSFDGATGDNAGTFSIVEDGKIKTSNEIDNLYAVYPYNESTSISNTGVLTVNFPAAQTYSATTFGQGSNTMVAVTDGTNMQFKNACGYLMFKLYGTSVSVKSVSLRGNNNEKIAGAATVSMPLNGTPSVVMSGSATDEIILTCTDAVAIGNSAENYTEFWFAIPPVTFDNGFTITVTDNNGKVFAKSTSSSLEIVRSYAKKMAPILVTPAIKPLTFKATGTTTIQLNASTDPAPAYSITLQYQKNNEAWASYSIGTGISLSDGETVSFRSGPSGNANFNATNNDGDLKGYYFRFTGGSVAASGSIMSLLVQSAESNSVPIQAFYKLFSVCTNLTSAPDLPATNLQSRCYENMFYYCSSLTTAPALPANTMAAYCYASMFERCSSLTAAPILPATTLAAHCYESMFYGCSQLSYIKMMATNISATDCLVEWVNGVNASGIFVKNSAASWDVTGNNGVPSGWTVETADN